MFEFKERKKRKWEERVRGYRVLLSIWGSDVIKLCSRSSLDLPLAVPPPSSALQCIDFR